MKFLETQDVCIKQRRAKLLLDLYDLLHQSRGTAGRVTLELWARVRGHANKPAAIRDLYRMKDLLESFGAKLEFGTEEEGLEIDLRDRALRAIVNRELPEATSFIEERRKKSGGSKALSHDDDTNESGTCLKCGETSIVPIDEVIAKRRHGASLLEICREFHIHQRRARMILKAAGFEVKHGRQRTEEARDKKAVMKAVAISKSDGPVKVKVIEIAAILKCSLWTAQRFIKRVRGGRMSSEDRSK